MQCLLSTQKCYVDMIWTSQEHFVFKTKMFAFPSYWINMYRQHALKTSVNHMAMPKWETCATNMMLVYDQHHKHSLLSRTHTLTNISIHTKNEQNMIIELSIFHFNILNFLLSLKNAAIIWKNNSWNRRFGTCAE